MQSSRSARVNVILSMFIYGTIGLFVRYIPLPSSVISMVRGLVGAPFLLLVLGLRKKRVCIGDIRRNIIPLLISGSLLGFNWILLFEAYRYTTVATAVLCYYLAPIIIVALSPIIFKERLSSRKICCIAAALFGMVFVSGAAENGIPSPNELRGILLGLGAALFYAGIVITNKYIKGISAYDKTITQLSVSVVWMLAYNILSGSFADCGELSAISLLLLAVLGVVHTGIAYLLYFGSMEHLPSQTLAILSYIDPVVAVLLSAFVLKENVGVSVLLGAALVLGAALISELPERKISGG